MQHFGASLEGIGITFAHSGHTRSLCSNRYKSFLIGPLYTIFASLGGCSIEKVGKSLMQRICHVSPTSIHSTRWIEAFQKKGYNVSLITDVQTWFAQKPRNVPIYVLPTLGIYNVHRRLIPNYISITKILKQIKPDLVHLHMQHHYAPAVYLSRMPYILHSWGLEVLELPQMSIFRRVLAKQVAMKAHKIIVDAKCMKQIWKNTGIPENKVEVIPFGVDTKLFNPNTNGNQIRKKLRIQKEDITIVSTRPFFNHYNVDCLVKAIPIIIDKHENVVFIIKGRGPLEGNIRKLAKKLRVDQYIRFTYLVPYHRLPQYLATANIYVSTSFIDSTSVSLLEAMACGLPAVVTDISGNREWIENGKNGLLFHPRNPKALADKLIQLIEDKRLRENFGRKCLQIVRERATWEDCVSKMETIYKSLM
jgi:glycosyltransferase involved in cell wall biosynthesis